MLVPLAKAAEMLGTGKHTYLVTTDGKVAIAPISQTASALSSIDAMNMMFAVVKSEHAEDTAERICEELDRLVAEIRARPVELTPDEKRAAAYRAIRGDGADPES
ncbi:MAG: hypothetical protein AAFY57_03840 [Cyanobacteria bacterium J06642_2]